MSEWWRNREQGRDVALNSLADVFIYLAFNFYEGRLTRQELMDAMDRIMWLNSTVQLVSEK
jgi:hypothetical protein